MYFGGMKKKRHSLILIACGLGLLALALLSYFPIMEFRRQNEELEARLKVIATRVLQKELDGPLRRRTTLHHDLGAFTDSLITRYTYIDSLAAKDAVGKASVWYLFDPRKEIGEGLKDQMRLVSDSMVSVVGNPKMRSLILKKQGRINYMKVLAIEPDAGYFKDSPPGYVLQDSLGFEHLVVMKCKREVALTDSLRDLMAMAYLPFASLTLMSDSSLGVAGGIPYQEFASAERFSVAGFEVSVNELLAEKGLPMRVTIGLKPNKRSLSTSFGELRKEKAFVQPVEAVVPHPPEYWFELNISYPKRQRLGLNYQLNRWALLWNMRFQLGSSLLVFVVMVALFLVMHRGLRHQQQLAQQQEEFIDNMTHELQTPIATLGALHEALEDFGGKDDVDKTQRYMGIARQQVKRLSHMADMVVHATQRGNKMVPQMDKFPLMDLRQPLLEDYGNREGVVFSVAFSDESISVKSDLGMLRMVLDNLIENAIKYHLASPAKVQVGFSLQENKVQITVADEGPGIAEKERERIFEKFYRVSQQGAHDVKGYGLGLYFAREVIEQLGGTLRIASTEGPGTKMCILLPYEEA